MLPNERVAKTRVLIGSLVDHFSRCLHVLAYIPESPNLAALRVALLNSLPPFPSEPSPQQ
jgi:hypothetical protein